VPSIGENLRSLRKLRSLGQVELGQRARVSQQTISGIERGHTDPHPATLRKLAEVLNVPVAAFFQEETRPRAPHAEMEAEDFDELRRKASIGELDGAALLEAVKREYDAIEAYYRLLLDRGAAVDATEVEEALELLVEARKRFRVLLFDRVEATIALDDERDPQVVERADTRLLPLDEADEVLRAAVRERA
jgi:transcriptional regulator with XRE-family HTH domain